MAETTSTGSVRQSIQKSAPEAVTERSRWQRLAACREAPKAVFFPVSSSLEEAAKCFCSACPVRAHCLAVALDHDEAFGVWGGLNVGERRAVASRRTGS